MDREFVARELLAIAKELTNEEHRFVLNPMKRARVKVNDAARDFDKKNYDSCLENCLQAKKWLEMIIDNLE